mgnify:CR=1 FL=1
MNISSAMVVAARHWRKICQTTLVNYGISEACAVPLLMIGRLGDGVHQVKVAQASGMESPSLVRLLDQLCSGGYVCRSEDTHDRRAKQRAWAIPASATTMATMGSSLSADGQGTDQQDDSGNETVHKTTSQENPTSGALLL